MVAEERPRLADLSLATMLAEMSVHERQSFLERLSEEEAERLVWEWRFWARPKQLAPEGDWDYWLVMAGRGFGKALDLNTPVPTPNGWTTMGEIKVGDQVFDERGQPCTVTYVSPVYLGKKTYKMTFDDGTEVLACDEHQWATTTKYARKNRNYALDVVTTEQIKQTLIWKVGNSNPEVNHAIPVCEPAQYPEKDLPIDPYVLGVWLGDGGTHHAEVTTADPEILDQIRQAGFEVGEGRNKNNITYPIKGLWTHLRELDILHNKHIPDVYLQASVEQRWALLQGLMDTDGTTSVNLGRNGRTRACSSYFSTTNKQLAQGFYLLAASLGLKVRARVSPAKLNGRETSKQWRLAFTTDRPIYRLARKLALLRPTQRRNNYRFIVKVEEVPSVPVRCISVDSSNHLFLVTRAFIPTHNTRTGAEWVREQVETGQAKRVALVGRTAADVRDVMVEGESGILSVSPPWFRPIYEPSKRRLTWPNGAIATTYTADKPDQLRGPQHDAGWADELAAWKYEDAWDQLQFGLRLGKKPRCVVTTTPRPVKVIKELIKNVKCHVTHGTTYENQENLAEQFINSIIRKYEGTRLGRQELLAALLEDVVGALWKRSQVEKLRVRNAPMLRRVVIGVDPEASSEEQSAETGIVVAGLGDDGRGYVLDDCSIRGTPQEWGRRVLAAYQRYEADVVIAEVNNGGEMVEYVLQSVARDQDTTINVRCIRASRGKYTRAEPVSALYEQMRVFHVGAFPELEDQMCTWVPGEPSPDRMDALVWALTALMIDATVIPSVLPVSIVEPSIWRDLVSTTEGEEV